MIRALLALALLWPLSAHAIGPKLPPGVTCEQVRANVDRYGEFAAYAWARLQGYSSKEINEARRCLKS